MKDPCEVCLVQSCCTEFCSKRGLYNRKTRKLYQKNKDTHLFEKAVDDTIKVFKRKYPNIPPLPKEQIKQIILEKR